MLRFQASRPHRNDQRRTPINWPAAAACLTIVAAFFLGGSARSDVSQLVLFRPLTAVALGAALAMLAAAGRVPSKQILIFVGLVAALVLAQLIPLPASVWSALPGRTLLTEVTSSAGIGSSAHPISMVPVRTLNAFMALLGPAALLIFGLLAIQQDGRRALLLTFIALGLLSVLIGLLQIIGPANGPLYFYRITSPGYSVGLFANRNHQAMMLACLLPMLWMLAGERWGTWQRERSAQVFAVGLGIFLVPMILVTGSRAGLLLGTLGIASAPLLYPFNAGPAGRQGGILGLPRSRWLPALILAVIVGIGTLTVFYSRAEAIYRLLNPNDARNVRVQSLSTSWAMAEKYFPVGSGFGTFSDVYKIDEPFRLLAPTYLNQAHNDWLQIVIEGGVPAILLGILFLVYWASRAWRAFRGRISERRTRYARLGTIISAQLLIGSAADYPLRVPALAMLFATAIIWMEMIGSASEKRHEKAG